MKKLIIILIFILSLSFLFACGDDGSTPVALLPEECTLPPTLQIINVSEYEILLLIKHTDPVGFNKETMTPLGTVIATNLMPETFLDHTVVNTESYYFTFTRDITSTSEYPIAVTTNREILFSGCHHYTLHLLEDGFFLDIEYYSE